MKNLDRIAYLERWSTPEPNSGCLLWVGSLDAYGYGQSTRFEGISKAHRLSWRIHRGPIPTGLAVLHKCDVRQCINPDHLFLGTERDNMRDMDAKGRRVNAPRPGERNGNAKLTEQQAKEIIERYRRGELRNHIAKRMGLTFPTVNRLVKGEAWKHLHQS